MSTQNETPILVQVSNPGDFPSGGGGGSGGAVTIADGADVTQGSKTDAVAMTPASSWSVISLLKGMLTALQGVLKVDGSAVTQPVSFSANIAQETGGHLASLDTKLPSLGQALSASSTPVVIASDQSSLPITISSLNIADGNDVALGAKADTPYTGSGASTLISIAKGIYSALVGTLKVDGSAVTQPVSLATTPLPVGAALDASVTAMSSKIPALGQAVMASSLPVTLASDQPTLPVSFPTPQAITITDGSLNTLGAKADSAATNTTSSWSLIALAKGIYNLLANTLNVAVTNTVPVTGSFYQSVQPVSGTVTITGVALDTSVQSVVTALTHGQGTMAQSVPVTLASNQSPLAVTGSFYQTTQPVSISGTVPVSGTLTVNTISGFALETGGNLAAAATSLATISTHTPALGQSVMSFSSPVVIASDQSSIPITTGPTITAASVSFSSSGDNTVIAAVSSKVIKVYKVVLVFAGAANITIKDGSSTALTGVMSMLANGSITLDNDGQPWFTTSASNALVMNISAGVQVSGRIYYTQA